MTRPSYKDKAASLAARIRSERGLENACRRIESYQPVNAAKKERA
jgi:hypothetical protein